MNNIDWISVKDRLPNEDIFVLCYTAKFGKINSEIDNYKILFYDKETKTWQNYEIDDFENNPDYVYVTHWTPLPNKPIPTQI